MEVIIRIALMFFFIQFLVVVTAMIAALLLARSEVPVLGRGPEQADMKRSFTHFLDLPNRVRRSVARLAHAVHLRGVQ